MNQGNIQHRTPNIEHPMAFFLDDPSMLGVGCSMFDVVDIPDPDLTQPYNP